MIHPNKQLTLTDIAENVSGKTVFVSSKQVDCHVFYCFVDPHRLKTFMLMHRKSLFCFIRQFWVERVANSNIFLQNQNCFRLKQVSRVQIFTTGKNFYFDQQKLLLWFIVFSPKKKRNMDRVKKLNLILRRHNGENIFRIGRSREATEPNIFSPN